MALPVGCPEAAGRALFRENIDTMRRLRNPLEDLEPPSHDELVEFNEYLSGPLLKSLREASGRQRGLAVTINNQNEPSSILNAIAELAAKNLISIRGRILITPAWSSYEEYLHSPEWDRTRRAARRRAKHRCQVCNTSKKQLDTHHRTYERLGSELPGDLIVLCRDCHTIFHKNGKLARSSS